MLKHTQDSRGKEELLVNKTDTLTCPLCTGVAALNGSCVTGPCQRLSLPTQQSLNDSERGTGCLCPVHNILLDLKFGSEKNALSHSCVFYGQKELLNSSAILQAMKLSYFLVNQDQELTLTL